MSNIGNEMTGQSETANERITGRTNVRDGCTKRGQVKVQSESFDVGCLFVLSLIVSRGQLVHPTTRFSMEDRVVLKRQMKSFGSLVAETLFQTNVMSFLIFRNYRFPF
jgi:hypothetical protein